MSPIHGRHLPFYAAAACGIAAMPLMAWLEPRFVVEASANVFFIVYLAGTAIRLPRLTAAYLKAHAASDDEPAPVIFAVTLGAAIVAVVSLFKLINAAHPAGSLELGLSLASVGFGWLTIHTMASLHYAHLHWRSSEGGKAGGGLEFPGYAEPGGYDFLYFAFVIGMTAQTSDVVITTTSMRKLNLLHAVTSFFFNTVLVAAAVNVAVSLAK